MGMHRWRFTKTSYLVYGSLENETADETRISIVLLRLFFIIKLNNCLLYQRVLTFYIYSIMHLFYNIYIFKRNDKTCCAYLLWGSEMDISINIFFTLSPA